MQDPGTALISYAHCLERFISHLYFKDRSPGKALTAVKKHIEMMHMRKYCKRYNGGQS